MKTTDKKAELLQFLANATKTYYECSGHLKTARNEGLIKSYKDQLTKLGTPIPTNEELLKVGEYNGTGSW